MNISCYSQILHSGKVSLFMEFWEEFPCFGVRLIFCPERKTIPNWHYFVTASVRNFSQLIIHSKKKKNQSWPGYYSQWKVMQPSKLDNLSFTYSKRSLSWTVVRSRNGTISPNLRIFPGHEKFPLFKSKLFPSWIFHKLGSMFTMQPLPVKIICPDQLCFDPNLFLKLEFWTWTKPTNK